MNRNRPLLLLLPSTTPAPPSHREQEREPKREEPSLADRFRNHAEALRALARTMQES